MGIDASIVKLLVNAVDLSAKCTQLGEVAQSREEQDITAFGDAIRKMQSTLEASPELPATFNQDFAGGSVHATLQPLFTNKTEFNVAVRPTNAVISATNPEFQFTATLIRYNPMDATQPGAVVKASATFRRTSAITVDVTP